MSDLCELPNADTALYLRLSREERPEAAGNSESIATQRMMLMQYAEQHGLSVAAEFTDDGISGTRHDRAGLLALMSAIGEGWIRTVLVKDLSRLSRDYIHTGELLERWFPAHGVRLISVNDGIDTAAQSGSNDFSAIRAVMDDWYARDISRKVRSAIYARQRAGYCTAAHLPYGYMRLGGAVCVDPARAAYVQQIFSGYLREQNCRKCAKIMEAIHAPSPGTGAFWNDTSVRRILQNTAYIGALRLHATQKAGYKCEKKTLLPAEAAIYFPVPPIVSEAVFQRAQVILHQRAHRSAVRDPYSAKLICGLCGSRMIRSENRYVCSGRKRGSPCANPSLRVDLLQSLLGEALQTAFGAESAGRTARAIRQITVLPDTLRVQMHCKSPDFRTILN